jgi:hypothetical protein
MREEFLDFHVIKNVRDVGYAGGRHAVEEK